MQTATLDEKEHGLSDEVLAKTDVLIWWGHVAHDKVEDAIVERVYQRVVDEGMGFIALHWGAGSKVFQKADGQFLLSDATSGWSSGNRFGWSSQRIPSPAAWSKSFVIPQTEMYGEPFDIPTPDTIVFISWYPGGEVFRSGCCFQRGRGKIFYFRPGHETYPIYHQAEVQQVIANAVGWAAP